MKPFLPACVLAAFLALFLSAPAAAFRKEAGAPGECAECHKLTKEEAGKMLGKVADNVVAVAARAVSRASGRWTSSATGKPIRSTWTIP